MARRLCLITGASAGIGAELARVFAERGYDLALVARRAAPMETLAANLETRFGTKSQIIVADLAAAGAVDNVLSAVGGPAKIDALVNNAGYGLPGAYANTNWAEQKAFIDVLFNVPCEFTHKVLPAMREKNFGRIMQVASLAGHLPGSAGHTLYAAIKSALVKFSQSLYLENLDKNIKVTALCPGFTFTEFHDVNGTRAAVSTMPDWMWQNSEEVAEEGFDAMEKGKPVVVTGFANKCLAALGKILPDPIALHIMARQSSKFRRVE